MSKFRKYSLNPETLLYELREVSRRTIFAKATLVFLGSVALALLYPPRWPYSSWRTPAGSPAWRC